MIDDEKREAIKGMIEGFGLYPDSLDEVDDAKIQKAYDLLAKYHARLWW